METVEDFAGRVRRELATRSGDARFADEETVDLVLKTRFAARETLSALAREFGLTPQRVFQIVIG